MRNIPAAVFIQCLEKNDRFKIRTKKCVMKTLIKILLLLLSISTAMTSCKTVPVTGRKQLNLVPDFMIQEMAFTAIRFSSKSERYTFSI